MLGVHRARAAARPRQPSGGARHGLGVAARDGRLLLGCSPGALELLEVQPPGGAGDGRRRLPARSRGAGRAVGARVGGQRRSPRRADAGRARARRRRVAQRDHAGPRLAARSPPRRRSGRPLRTLAEASSIGQRQDRGRLQLVLARRAHVAASGRARCARRSPRTPRSFSLGLGRPRAPARAASPSGSWPSGASPSGRARARRSATPSGTPARPRRAPRSVRLATEPWQ